VPVKPAYAAPDRFEASVLRGPVLPNRTVDHTEYPVQLRSSIAVPAPSTKGEPPPGALIAGCTDCGSSDPTLAYSAFSPLMTCAVTPMTPRQLAGGIIARSASFPAAATTTAPTAVTASTASCMNCGHADPMSPPRLTLMIDAGVAFAGMPGTDRPALHRMASAMSDSVPPHLPTARTGCTRTFQATPAMPVPLFAVGRKHAGHVRAVPAAVCGTVPQYPPNRRRSSCRYPVAGIGRIGVAAVAVVGDKVGGHASPAPTSPEMKS
jgi:hypothetical protein